MRRILWSLLALCAFSTAAQAETRPGAASAESGLVSAEGEIKIAGKPATAKSAAVKSAAAKDERKLKTVQKSVSGTIVTIWRNQLAVQFAVSEEEGAEEIVIPIDKRLKLSGAKDISEVKRGDTVKVDYEITVEDKEWEGEPPVLGTRARELTIVKRAKAEDALYAE